MRREAKLHSGEVKNRERVQKLVTRFVIRRTQLRLTLIHLTRTRLLILRMVPVRAVGRHYRDSKTHALRRENIAPVRDQLLVGRADRANVSVEIEKANGVYIVVAHSQRAVPIGLIGERKPCETDDRHTVVAYPQNIGPLLP